MATRWVGAACRCAVSHEGVAEGNGPPEKICEINSFNIILNHCYPLLPLLHGPGPEPFLPETLREAPNFATKGVRLFSLRLFGSKHPTTSFFALRALPTLGVISLLRGLLR